MRVASPERSARGQTFILPRLTIFRRGVRQLPHAEVIDDQQRHGREIGEVRLACAVERGVREFFHQRVRLAIENAVALLDDGTADGLSQVAFPRPWWPKKERVFPLRDETAGGELVDQRPVHLLVEIEIEGIERAIRITEASLLMPALELPI